MNVGFVWHQTDLGVERLVANEGRAASGVKAINAILGHRNKRR